MVRHQQIKKGLLLFPVVIHRNQPKPKHDHAKGKAEETLLLPETFKNASHGAMKARQ